ncbi:MAG: hypothetical protein KAI24_08690 [Planctomycetes bacterium]|nr:hypothetical protein [Planctomycetota bacterium]
MTSEIEIKIGAVALTCRGELAAEQLDSVLRSLRRELPELMAQEQRQDGPSVGELLQRSSAKTHADKAGVVAFWLESHCGRSEWRSSDITDALAEAGEELPKNITDALNQKRDKGLFEVHDRRWKLTDEGRGWVKYGLLDKADHE